MIRLGSAYNRDWGFGRPRGAHRASQLRDALTLLACCKYTWKITIETHERRTKARLDAADGQAKMDIDIRIASNGIIETLRERIAELEDLEASDSATPDTREELADLHEFLRRLYMISLGYARETLQ